MNCLQGFKEENSRDEHIVCCMNNESVKVEMPQKEPDSTIFRWSIPI